MKRDVWAHICSGSFPRLLNDTKRYVQSEQLNGSSTAVNSYRPFYTFSYQSARLGFCFLCVTSTWHSHWSYQKSPSRWLAHNKSSNAVRAEIRMLTNHKCLLSYTLLPHSEECIKRGTPRTGTLKWFILWYSSPVEGLGRRWAFCSHCRVF